MTNKWLKVALMVTAIATGTSINIDAEPYYMYLKMIAL